MPYPLNVGKCAITVELQFCVIFCHSRVLSDRAQCQSVLISNINSNRTGPTSHSTSPATVPPVRLRQGTFHLLVQVLLLRPILCRLCFLLSLSNSRCNNSNSFNNNNTCSSRCYRPVFHQVCHLPFSEEEEEEKQWNQ